MVAMGEELEGCKVDLPLCCEILTTCGECGEFTGYDTFAEYAPFTDLYNVAASHCINTILICVKIFIYNNRSYRIQLQC